MSIFVKFAIIFSRFKKCPCKTYGHLLYLRFALNTYFMDIYSLWWQNNPSLWLSWTVSIPKYVSILWHAACAPSDAKLLEGGVYSPHFPPSYHNRRPMTHLWVTIEPRAIAIGHSSHCRVMLNCMLIHSPKRCKDSQSQSLKHPCRISKLWTQTRYKEFHSNEFNIVF